MNKTALKIIKIIAEELPQQKYKAAHEDQLISGKDVLLTGIKESDTGKIDKDKEYVLNVPVIREVDHKRRMKEIYKKRGKVGLITYLKPFINPLKLGQIQSLIMKSMP